MKTNHKYRVTRCGIIIFLCVDIRSDGDRQRFRITEDSADYNLQRGDACARGSHTGLHTAVC